MGLHRKLRFKIYIKPLFEKYLKVVNVFHRVAKNLLPILLDRQLR